MRIKFCGLTRAEDVLIAANLGVAALGFVCVPASKRYVDMDQAAALVRVTPPFVHSVGLFQNAPAELVRATLARAKFSMLQFHGTEEPSYCASFGLPFIKAIPMADAPDLSACAIAFAQASALLLDSHSLQSADKTGGSGHCFDWASVDWASVDRASVDRANVDRAGVADLKGQNGPSYLILAGGLTLENVASGIRLLRPYAVDVSSGIESSPGIKDAKKMRQFVDAVRAAQI